MEENRNSDDVTIWKKGTRLQQQQKNRQKQSKKTSILSTQLNLQLRRKIYLTAL